VVTPSFTAAVVDRFHDARLDAAVARILDRIKAQTAILISTSLADDKATATLVVSVRCAL
jgi:hexosaminidase